MLTMKKLFLLVFSFLFLISCDSSNSNLELEPQTIETFKANQVFFPGEVLQSKSAKSVKKIPNLFGCGVTGPNCASPNQTLTYTYANSSINTNATWTIDSGSISISGGQGTNTVNLIFGSNFTGGYVTVSGAGIPNCSVTFEILKCGDTPPDPIYCGVSADGVTELNLLGDGNVAFLAQHTLNSLWNITSSVFIVHFEDGSGSTILGNTNFQGFPQIIIPVLCTNKVTSVDVTIYAESSSGDSCSASTTEIFQFGVCGTAGFN
jgi:hypothetical protein